MRFLSGCHVFESKRSGTGYSSSRVLAVLNLIEDLSMIAKKHSLSACLLTEIARNRTRASCIATPYFHRVPKRIGRKPRKIVAQRGEETRGVPRVPNFSLLK